MSKVLCFVFGAVIMGALSYWIAASAFGGPVVFISHTTGGCAYWEDAAGRHDCTSAPEHADRIWIE